MSKQERANMRQQVLPSASYQYAEAIASALSEPVRRPREKNGKLGQKARVELLRQVPLFANVAPQSLAGLAMTLREHHCAPGTLIFAEGSHGNSLFVIAEGAVSIETGARRVAELRPGDCFGELAMVDGHPRSASVSSLVATVLCEIDGDQLFALMKHDIDIAKGILCVMANRLRETLDETNKTTS